MRTIVVFPVAIAVLAGGVHGSSAQTPPEVSTGTTPSSDEPTVREARDAFVRGTKLVEESDWASALEAFERSHRLRPHPVTRFNVGVCERALGHLTRARRTLRSALDEGADGGLPDTLAEEAKGYLVEIDRVLVHLSVDLDPASAAIAVDGRPLEQTARKEPIPELVANLRPPGPGEVPPAARFSIVVNPGAHVFIVSRKGFSDAVVRRTFEPGARQTLALRLDRLPAMLQVGASQPGAVVRVNGMDVGVAPVEVSRPAGTYRVSVYKDGFEPYETRVVAQPGEETKLRAVLRVREPGLAERWWFWAGIGAVVASAGIVTYAVTRPEPERAPVNGGSLGWEIDLR